MRRSFEGKPNQITKKNPMNKRTILIQDDYDQPLIGLEKNKLIDKFIKTG